MTIHGIPLQTPQQPRGAAASPSTPTFGGPPNTPVGTVPLTSRRATRSDDDTDRNLPAFAKDLLPHGSPKDDSLARYANLAGFTQLVLSPFFQGLFYGLGEGTAKILLGRHFGVDPFVSLGRNPDLKPKRVDKVAGLATTASCGEVSLVSRWASKEEVAAKAEKVQEEQEDACLRSLLREQCTTPGVVSTPL
ncbi:hypothetical protein HK097_011705 [Rhizophlyctis rosea]|uniref:Uncharacterized protein n=1 Tax=Rhizophlyctis rosea TaxID=64517 RepID=A0AAD5SE07_9FUNG|nr:hypothetical protein HK097_011705 [Rhizophlyctis rosea]